MMIEGNFKPGFRLRLHQKDLANAMTTAKEASIPLPVAALLQQIVTALVENGNGELDHAAIARFVEDMAHTRIHGS
jgi:2-hydroxy-3-oxopropionate reductase